VALNFEESSEMEIIIQQYDVEDGVGDNNIIEEEEEDDDDVVLPELSQEYTTTTSQRNSIVLHIGRHSFRLFTSPDISKFDVEL
jgi:hypothetical protein